MKNIKWEGHVKGLGTWLIVQKWIVLNFRENCWVLNNKQINSINNNNNNMNHWS